MIRKLEGFNRYIAITGFRNVKVEDIDKLFTTLKEKTGNGAVQFFNAKLVAGWEHLYFAALNAVNALENKLNISNSLSIEILLYASAQRQIKEAVKSIGIHPNCKEVAVVILANTRSKISSLLSTVSELLTGGVQDDKILELTDEKFKDIKKLFGISDTELKAKLEKKGGEKEALTDLVIEHVALLVTQR